MSNLFSPADILLPKNNFNTWSVIACDQYTSQEEYWVRLREAVGDNPSSLNIILPEVYLSRNNNERISKINSTMKEYLDNGIFNEFKNTVVYTERKLKDGKLRRGIVGLIDLEEYSYTKNAKTLIRATEETVTDRIPPRVEIRKDATLEIPHIMLLINDEDKNVIEPLESETDSFQKLYDFELLQNGGSIKGFKISESQVERIEKELGKLRDKSVDGLLFAVGDGNHSLATAKECYNKGYGSKYALVEVVNIHDASLEFEPIYRVLFNANPQKVIDDILNAFGGEYFGEDAQKFICTFKDAERTISLKPTGKLSVATLQAFLDKYIKENPEIEIDYIHGTDSVRELTAKENTIGFIFDGMEKSDLFPAVSQDGSLPRKTFSMGCADDKRFYLETRKI